MDCQEKAHIGASPVDEGGAAGQQLQVMRLGSFFHHRIDGEGSTQVAQRHQHKQSRQHLRDAHSHAAHIIFALHLNARIALVILTVRKESMGLQGQ